jgi:hypothetical protein
MQGEVLAHGRGEMRILLDERCSLSSWLSVLYVPLGVWYRLNPVAGDANGTIATRLGARVTGTLLSCIWYASTRNILGAL